MSCSASGAFLRRPDASFREVLAAPAPERKRLWRCLMGVASWVRYKQTMPAPGGLGLRRRGLRTKLVVELLPWPVVPLDPLPMLLHLNAPLMKSGHYLLGESGWFAVRKYLFKPLQQPIVGCGTDHSHMAEDIKKEPVSREIGLSVAEYKLLGLGVGDLRRQLTPKTRGHVVWPLLLIALSVQLSWFVRFLGLFGVLWVSSSTFGRRHIKESIADSFT
jgi:hypothetical protein